MLSLLYVSLSRLMSPDPERELDAIMAAAAPRNLQSGVTGALVWTGGDFAQVLEGEESDVVAIMGSILLDRRHDHVRVISREAIARRRFPNWGMARIGHSPEVQQAIAAIWTAPDDARLQRAVGALVGWMAAGASARVPAAPLPA